MFKKSIVILLSVLSVHISAQFRAVYLPDEKIQDIDIDGDTLDWLWVPREFGITMGALWDGINNSGIDRKDWSCKTIVAWNHLTNYLYVLAIVKDDIKSVDRKTNEEPWLDDGMEVVVNPNNLGGKYNHKLLPTYNYVMKFCYSFPAIDGVDEFLIYDGPSWYLEKDKYVKRAGKTFISKDNHHSTTVYELAISLWDYWDDTGADLSIRHKLKANEIIKLSIAFNDVDNIKDVRDAQWMLVTTDGDWWRNASRLSYFMLSPPVENGVSWGQINALMDDD
jgi:hypothetical protein